MPPQIFYSAGNRFISVALDHHGRIPYGGSSEPLKIGVMDVLRTMSVGHRHAHARERVSYGVDVGTTLPGGILIIKGL